MIRVIPAFVGHSIAKWLINKEPRKYPQAEEERPYSQE